MILLNETAFIVFIRVFREQKNLITISINDTKTLFKKISPYHETNQKNIPINSTFCTCSKL